METATRHEAAEARYVAMHQDVRDYLANIEELLHDMPAPDGDLLINWGHVGDIEHVSELLQRIISNIGGK